LCRRWERGEEEEEEEEDDDRLFFFLIFLTFSLFPVYAKPPLRPEVNM
jgi:hypothetical protein